MFAFWKEQITVWIDVPCKGVSRGASSNIWKFKVNGSLLLLKIGIGT